MSSSVKVGVRIRPLLAKEANQGMSLTSNESNRFNVTIMAYGQTGSGKTYTMGTSDALDDVSCQGLIPRFVNDLFDNLAGNECGKATRAKVKVSFLEIYGEDVYDLIGVQKASSLDRPSLPIREDEFGHVFVQGQNEIEVHSVDQTLQLLCTGTRSRITGSTAMNSGSSRSHAVFSVALQQSVHDENADTGSAGCADDVDDVHCMTSRLTFVDLAGSERIKRTGAEGQRLKEGIQINSGLFNLGQVITALADDQKIKKGGVFVPYRNSKLTHLLKDALGGNSQTLFLACVSPAESNEGESMSTLAYARQARNIQNKPIKNMDKTQVEIRRLKYCVKAWMMKALCLKFGLTTPATAADATKSNGDCDADETERMESNKTRELAACWSPLPCLSPLHSTVARRQDKDDEDAKLASDMASLEAQLRDRTEVQEYVHTVNAAIANKLQSSACAVSSSSSGGARSLVVKQSSAVSYSPPHKAHSSAAMATRPLTTGCISVGPSSSSVMMMSECAESSKCQGLSSIGTVLDSVKRNLKMSGTAGRRSSVGKFAKRLSMAVVAHKSTLKSTSGALPQSPPLPLRDDISEHKARSTSGGEENEHVQDSKDAEAGDGFEDDEDENDEFEDDEADPDPEETERLIGRMLEMVNHEKQSSSSSSSSSLQNDSSSSSSQLLNTTSELVAVDKVIEEKEQILHKLLDTVKSYAAMKSDFEKLVDAIGSLETERRELELELEKAKKQQLDSNNSQGSSSASSSSSSTTATSAGVERIKERYLKVKDELKQMRDQQRSKESAYRLMQKESKQCESLLRDIQKLKESKVVMVKQQRTQAVQLQKMKKEQAVKLCNVKKADVKKLRQLNTLKSELLKKERVLGHKDREIARITSKLKACEEHVGQLLKIQTRNRAKVSSTTNNSSSSSSSGSASTTATATLASRSNTKSNGDALQLNVADKQAMTTLGVALSAQDQEHWTTSRGMLDHLVCDRLQQRMNKAQYDCKSLQLQELHKELSREMVGLEVLEARQRAVRQLLTEEEVLLAEGDQGDYDDFGMDDDVEKDFNNTAAAERKEKITEAKQIRQEIAHQENKIDRITSELDLFNADLTDLKERVGDEDCNSWEELGKDIVLGLTLPQCQVFAWALLQEKTEAAEKRRMADDILAVGRGNEVELNANLASMNKEVLNLTNELSVKLEQAENKRINDLWTIMKAQQQHQDDLTAQNETDNDTTVAVAASAASSETYSEIAMMRAQELEKAFNASVSRESSQQLEILALNERIARLESDATAHRLRSELHCVSGSDPSPVAMSLTVLNELLAAWDVLGVGEADRSQTVADLNRRTRALQAESDRQAIAVQTEAASTVRFMVQSTRTEVQELEKQLAMVSAVLSSSSAAEPRSGDHHEEGANGNAQQQDAKPESASLLSRKSVLSATVTEKLAVLHDLLLQMTCLQSKLADLARGMWLRKNDLSPALQQLMNIQLSPNNQSTAQALSLSHYSWALQQVTILHNKHDLRDLSMHMQRWTEDMRKLNITRAQHIAAIMSKCALTQALADDLQLAFNEKKLIQISQCAVEMSFPEDQEDNMSTRVNSLNSCGSGGGGSADAMTLAVQLVLKKGPPSPPGSAKVLTALDQLHILLESVKVNRKNIASQLTLFINKIDCYLLGEASSISSSEPKIPSSLEDILRLLSRACDAKTLCTKSVQSYTYQLTEAMKLIGDSNFSAETLGSFLQSNSKVLPEGAYADLCEMVEDLEGQAMFLEETDVKSQVEEFLTMWSSADSVTVLLQQVYVLRQETDRLQQLSAAVTELLRLDVQLSKHVEDMEAFEVSSKQDRAKVLNGNSRALVEEEKFRKNGKKKYEVLSERLVQQAQTVSALQLTTAPLPCAATAHQQQQQQQQQLVQLVRLPVCVDLTQQLSSQSMGLLSTGSKHKEVAELMHLNTASAASSIATVSSVSGSNCASSASRRVSNNSSSNDCNSNKSASAGITKSVGGDENTSNAQSSSRVSRLQPSSSFAPVTALKAVTSASATK